MMAGGGRAGGLSRRRFIGSAAALGFGLGAGRLRAVESPAGGAGAPLAKIGLFTDTHVGYKGTFRRLERGYRLFKAQGVDRIVNLGDIADVFDPPAYARYAAIRREVYPEPVPETYLFATHDRKRWPGPDDPMHETCFRKVKELLGIAHGRYDTFTAAGYTFLAFPQVLDYARYEKMVDEACAAQPGRPVFVLDHVPPLTPQEGAVLGGDPKRTRVLERHPQVVSLSGHVHGTLAHEGKIWQGAFTAINFGNLKQLPPGMPYHVAVLELHADRLVVRRYAVETGEELHPDAPWTVTWPRDAKAARYAPATRAASEPKLGFPPASTLSLAPDADGIAVTFPACAPADRVAHYLVESFVRAGGDWKPRTLQKFGADFSCPPAKRRTVHAVRIAGGAFSGGESVRVVVKPVGFFANEGAALAAETALGGLKPWKVLFSGVPAPARAGAFCPFAGGKRFDIPAATWKGIKPGTRCRAVLDLTVLLPADRTLGYGIETDDRSVVPLRRAFLPLGNSSYVHQGLFRCPKHPEKLKLAFSRTGRAQVRFNAFRIEAEM